MAQLFTKDWSSMIHLLLLMFGLHHYTVKGKKTKTHAHPHGGKKSNIGFKRLSGSGGRTTDEIGAYNKRSGEPKLPSELSKKNRKELKRQVNRFNKAKGRVLTQGSWQSSGGHQRYNDELARVTGRKAFDLSSNQVLGPSFGRKVRR